MSFLCAIGLHKPAVKHEWVPSILAEIVTEVKCTCYCQRCERVIGGFHWKWDEQKKEMVDA